MCLHAADVSQQVREFDVVKQWTYLLFDEFFDQGDMEKEQGLSVSFLCDRVTTNVAKNQSGFINFIPLPLFKVLVNISPQLGECVDELEKKSKLWNEYEETEEDKEIYLPKDNELIKIIDSQCQK